MTILATTPEVTTARDKPQPQLVTQLLSSAGRWFSYHASTGEFTIKTGPDDNYLAPEVGRAVLAGIQLLWDVTPEEVADDEVQELYTEEADDNTLLGITARDPELLYRALSLTTCLSSDAISMETRMLVPHVADDLDGFIDTLHRSGIRVSGAPEASPSVLSELNVNS